MLDELDRVDWAALTHAYGPAHDVPGMLREAALDDLYGSIFARGEVYSATAAAVPFLVSLAAGGRADFLWMVGLLADPAQTRGETALVRAAVRAERDRLVPLLSHPAADMRAAAAYALARCDIDPAILRERWDRETDAGVRASLVPGLRLTAAITDPDPAVRASAAVTLVRDGIPLPRDPAVVEGLAAAVEAGAEVPWLRWAAADWLDVVVPAVADPALVSRLLRSLSADTRRAAVRALTLRCQASRSAPAVLVPLLGPSLHDPQVRDEAVTALRRCGRAAARYADDLSEIAAGYPAVAAQPSATTEREALETLMIIGDPRWVGPVVRAALTGVARPPGSLMPLPCTPAVLDAVREQLAARPDATAVIEVLCDIVARWGTAAADAVPDLLAALPSAPAAATRALLAAGHVGPPMIPGLRAAATRPGGLLAATALFRLTGDPKPALRALLTARPPIPPEVVGLLGPLAQPLVPEFELLLTGEAAATQPQCAAQLLAAQIVIAATGDTTAALPTLHAVLTAGGPRAALATAVVAELAGETGGWRGEMRVWEPELRALLDDPWADAGAAAALWRLGMPAGELVPVLTGAIERGRRIPAAISLLREMGAGAELADLAGRDERLVGEGADLVSTDELLRDRLTAQDAYPAGGLHRD
ncbi:hypothetical protein [Actinoplanes sp. NPDC049681]|uniref:hypothetical protein n=1 Tax=Actinoplanes sp. NPDC049681 TaxID=3363905 RepID=UPI00378DC50F